MLNLVPLIMMSPGLSNPGELAPSVQASTLAFWDARASLQSGQLAAHAKDALKLESK